MTEPIVVTGLGFVCPLGTGAEAVWEAWSRGESGIRRLSEDDPRRSGTVDPVALPAIGRAGFVRGFEPREHIRSPHLRRMDWCSRMIVASAVQAVADAGLSFEDEAAQARTALVVGSCFGNQRETQKYMTRVLRSGPAAGQPILFPNLVLNAAAGYTAIELKIRGPNLSVSEHEASGEAAVATAADLLRAGLCDRVVVGSADEFSDVYLGALRERRLLDPGSWPDGARRPAGLGRIVPGEGAAAFVLETEDSARARGRTPYAAVHAAPASALPSGPYVAADPDAAAEHELASLDERAGARRPVSALIGGANGTRARDALDRALLERLAARQARPPSYVRLDDLVGDWPSRGALGVALASLAAGRGVLPGAGDGPALERLLVPGSGRSGVLVPIVVDVLGR